MIASSLLMRILLTAAVFLFVSGCGADEVPVTPNDGKIRPPPSGVRTTEAIACSALSDAHSKTLLTVGCVGTSATCPGLLRTQQSGATCLEYDKGSLDGCITHIKAQTACPDIATALGACIVYAYEGSAPAGCP